MSGRHPTELDLASTDAREVAAATARHLRSCSRCRTIQADYRWVREELVATLRAADAHVPVPAPLWERVRAGLWASESLAVRREHWAVMGTAALVLCVILVATPAMGATALELAAASRLVPIQSSALTGERPLSATVATPLPPCPAGSGADEQLATPALAAVPIPADGLAP